MFVIFVLHIAIVSVISPKAVKVRKSDLFDYQFITLTCFFVVVIGRVGVWGVCGGMWLCVGGVWGMWLCVGVCVGVCVGGVCVLRGYHKQPAPAGYFDLGR